MGRAGRVKESVCYRIYSGDTYNTFKEKYIPKILLESTEEIILALKSIGIKNLSSFHFCIFQLLKIQLKF